MRRICFAKGLMKKNSRYYFAILALALVLRITWAIAVPVQPFSDPLGYDAIARNIVSGGGFGFQPGVPTAHWVPGPPFVFAFFYFVFGHTYIPIVVLNIALGVFMVAAAMRLAEWWFDRRVSLVTGLLLAIWLNLIEFTTLLASELLFCALLLGALLAWMHPTANWRRRAVGAGILLGAACYVRTIGLTVPFIFVLLEWLRGAKLSPLQVFRRTLAPVAVLAIAIGLTIAPWSLRNTLTFGRFILISTNGGEVFWNGNNVNSDGKSMAPTPQLASANLAEEDAYLTSEALLYAREHPFDFAAGFFKKLVLLHSRESIGVVWNELGLSARWGQAVLLPLKAVNAAYWYLVLGLALGGIAVLVKQQGWRAVSKQPAVWLWFYPAVTIAVFLGQDRYHIPMIPAIAMLAAYALVFAYDARRARIGMRGLTPRASAQFGSSGPEIAKQTEV